MLGEYGTNLWAILDLASGFSGWLRRIVCQHRLSSHSSPLCTTLLLPMGICGFVPTYTHRICGYVGVYIHIHTHIHHCGYVGMVCIPTYVCSMWVHTIVCTFILGIYTPRYIHIYMCIYVPYCIYYAVWYGMVCTHIWCMWIHTTYTIHANTTHPPTIRL